MRKKSVAVIGGGTGTYTVLSGLKKFPLKLTAVVSMMDSGGSNRVIRDEFGLLPTSDIRQCMVALASDKSHELLRQLFTYRYSQGTGISGMTFGNLFMAALTDIYGAQEEAIEKTCEILDVEGDIVPVTYDDVHLVARYSNGKQVLGEHFIDEPDDDTGKHRIIEMETIPEAIANTRAIKAIKNADLIILGPGDLYTSTICNLLVKGIKKAINQSTAKVIYIMNLMTKHGETHGFTAKNHIDELEKYLGGGEIDICLVNKTRDFPKRLLERYAQEKAESVKDDLVEFKAKKIIRKNFVSSRVYKKSKGDQLTRSLIRHDSDKLAKTIANLV